MAANAPIALLVFAAGATAVWVGFTDPPGGASAALGSILRGAQPARRTAAPSNPLDLVPALYGSGSSAAPGDAVSTSYGSTGTSSGAADKAGLIAFGKQLQQQGYSVSEHPAFGGVHPVHVSGSQHYVGEAIDVNADGMAGGEPAALDKANAAARAAGFTTLWRTTGHFNHLHVAVPRKGVAV